ncbi:MAG: CPBP family intramembrane metalloprotease [Nitrososphaerota archaeon]|nr:CPBP family intramembrane metalloprotease [Nitrososphaerota archaeon]
MQNSGYLPHKAHHYLALVFAVLLLLLTVTAFTSFAIGAYLVYNRPISNVIANTQTVGGQTVLHVDAVGLNGSSSRIIWIDPQVTYDASGNRLINVSSGIRIANTTTDSSGDIAGNFTIQSSVLQQIAADGQQVHSVWVIGLNQSSTVPTSQYVYLTYDSEQNYTAASRGSGITFFVTLFTFVVPFNFSLGNLFLALWTIYLALFAMALNGPMKSVIGALKTTAKKGVGALFDNSIYGTMLVFPLVLWSSVLLEMLQQAGGVSTGNLPLQDPFLTMVELSIAPLREELGFRVIPIGIAAFVVLLTKGRVRDGLLSLWHPSKYLKKVDSPVEYKRHLNLIYLMIAISSILFGVAHYLLGAGWGPGKIAEAAVAGVALGGLYYKYGFPSTVLLHWLIDYFLTTYTLTPTLTNYGNWIVLYSVLIAIISTAVLLMMLFGRFRNRPATVYPESWVQGTA